MTSNNFINKLVQKSKLFMMFDASLERISAGIKVGSGKRAKRKSSQSKLSDYCISKSHYHKEINLHQGRISKRG